MTHQRTSSPDSLCSGRQEASAWGWLLMLWMSLVVGLHGWQWTSGAVERGLAQAVEEGTAHVERQLLGEENRDVVRKAIQLQRNSLKFWLVIAAIRDGLVAPLMLGLRALLVAVALAAVAAVTGRPARFGETMYACVAWQGIWVLGLAVRIVLTQVLQRAYVGTSVLMFLTYDSFSAPQWTLLEQLDCFAMVGWLGMAWEAWRRGQARLPTAFCVCLVLATTEVYVRHGASLLVNLSMRMALFSQ